MNIYLNIEFDKNINLFSEDNMSANIIDIPIVVTDHDHDSGRARERDKIHY